MNLKLLFAKVAASMLMAAPLAASAAIALQLDDSSTVGVDQLIVDGGPGDIDGLVDGKITYLGSAGNWTINVSTGLGNGVLAAFGIDLNSVNVSGAGAGILTLAFTETDLNFGAAGPTSVTGGIGGTAGGTLGYALFADDGNNAFGTGSTVFSGSAGPGAFSASGGSSVALNDPFSLTLQVTIDHQGVSGRSSSFDFEGNVPEPASLALVGVALLAAGATARRRRT
jgi:hypothetical protein